MNTTTDHEHKCNQRTWTEPLSTESKAQLLRHPELDEALQVRQRPVGDLPPSRPSAGDEHWYPGHLIWYYILLLMQFLPCEQNTLGRGKKKAIIKALWIATQRLELKKSRREKTEVMSTILGMLMTQPSTCKATLITWKFLSDCMSPK